MLARRVEVAWLVWSVLGSCIAASSLRLGASGRQLNHPETVLSLEEGGERPTPRKLSRASVVSQGGLLTKNSADDGSSPQRRMLQSGLSATLNTGQSLRPGDSLQSASGVFRLVYGIDGDLVMYEGGDTDTPSLIWTANTDGKTAGFANMTDDGHFQLCSDESTCYKQFGKSGLPIGQYQLQVQDSGNVTIASLPDNVVLYTLYTYFCPEIDGYTMLKNRDHPGDDIGARVGAKNAYQMAAICDANCVECVGFTSGGWLKNSLGLTMWPPIVWDEQCLYQRTAPCPGRNSSSVPPPPPAVVSRSLGSTLRTGQRLLPGQRLESPDGWFSLVYRPEGNLALYEGRDPPRGAWESRTYNKVSGAMTVDQVGLLKLCSTADASDGCYFSMGNPATPGQYQLELMNGGDIVIQSATNASAPPTYRLPYFCANVTGYETSKYTDHLGDNIDLLMQPLPSDLKVACDVNCNCVGFSSTGTSSSTSGGALKSNLTASFWPSLVSAGSTCLYRKLDPGACGIPQPSPGQPPRKLAPPPAAPPGASPPALVPSQPRPAPSLITDSSKGSSGLGPNAAAGIAVAVAVALIVVGTGAWCLLRKRRASQPPPATPRAKGDQQQRSKLVAGEPSDSGHSSELERSGAVVAKVHTAGSGRQRSAHSGAGPLSPKPSLALEATPLKAVGLIPGDPFLRATAHQYKWITLPAEAPTVDVEAGINDYKLDRLPRLSGDGTPAAAAAVASTPRAGECRVVRLSCSQVQHEIELLSDGLLGRGGAALVFKGRWPSRFGPNALLAVKVLKDAYDASPAILDSFVYEARVLATVRHPHIVRMYGYCLELPTMCLIMELLPCSLEWLVHPQLYTSSTATTERRYAANTTTHFQEVSGHQSRSRHKRTRSGGGNGSRANSMSPSVHTEQYSSPDASQGSGTSSRKQVTDGEGRGQQLRSPTTPTYGRSRSTSGSTVGGGTTAPFSPGVEDSQRSDVSIEGPGNDDSPSSLRTPSVVRGSLDSQAPHASVFAKHHACDPKPRSVPPLTMQQVLQIAADVAAGLAYLHEKHVGLGGRRAVVVEVDPQDQGDEEEEEEGDGLQTSRIVHRDLKPGNVLISSLGRAKISDFGLARQHQATTVHTSHAGAGTLIYMAPELLMSRRGGQYAPRPTNRVDIYSLGIMIWEMVSRRRPFEGMHEGELIAAVCNKVRPPFPARMSRAYRPAAASTPATPMASGPRASSETPTAGPETSRVAAPMTMMPSQDELSRMPAAFDAVPGFVELIEACWRHRDLRRPTAAQVYELLSQLQRGQPVQVIVSAAD